MSTNTVELPAVFVDADNTLWDTDGIFARAQLGLLEALEEALSTVAPDERLAFIRQIDQTLAESHHLGLRYPVRFLILAAARGLQGFPLDRSLTSVWSAAQQASSLDERTISAVEEKYLADLKRMPPLLPGVADGLKRLHGSGVRIFVVTEGNRDRAKRTAQELQIEKYIERFIEAPKHARLYKRVLRLAAAKSGVMIGDQLQRDIKPAQAAGLLTIYIPSKFRPRWEIQEAVQADFQCFDFSQAVDRVLAAIDHHQQTPKRCLGARSRG